MAAIIIKSEAQRLVFGEVYVPDELDSDMEMMTAKGIESMAHEFLSSGRVNNIDVNHDYTESGCLVVESYIAKANDPDGFKKGAWVLGVRIGPDDLWQAVLKGDFNGFSFGGVSDREPVLAEVRIAKRVEGTTEKSTVEDLEEHSHEVIIMCDDLGKVIPTMTAHVLGHSHAVVKISATATENGHAHRIVISK